MGTRVSRREALKIAGLGAVAAALDLAGCGQATILSQEETMAPEKSAAGKYELPPLPYAFGALEPVIDAKTVELHHDKHHAGYVKGANDVLEKLDKARAAADYAAVKALSRDLAFNGSGAVLL